MNFNFNFFYQILLKQTTRRKTLTVIILKRRNKTFFNKGGCEVVRRQQRYCVFSYYETVFRQGKKISNGSGTNHCRPPPPPPTFCHFFSQMKEVQIISPLLHSMWVLLQGLFCTGWPRRSVFRNSRGNKTSMILLQFRFISFFSYTKYVF